MHKEIRTILFRLERILIMILFMFCIKFSATQFSFWVAVIMLSIIMNKFEDAIRREYDDTTANRLKKLMDEDDGR